jgi:CBS domain-containing protein
MWEPTVGSVMTKEVVTARPDTPFKELVASLSEHRVSGLPVVDSEGKPAGVVSEADTLAKQEYQGGTVARPLFAGRKRRARWHKAAGLTAGELMTAPAVVIGENETVSAAARLLAKKNVRRICVVDAAGMLVGLVSRHDVIGTFLRDDDAIRADVEEHVFKRGMWLFPEPLTAEVTGGCGHVGRCGGAQDDRADRRPAHPRRARRRRCAQQGALRTGRQRHRRVVTPQRDTLDPRDPGRVHLVTGDVHRDEVPCQLGNLAAVARIPPYQAEDVTPRTFRSDPVSTTDATLPR